MDIAFSTIVLTLAVYLSILLVLGYLSNKSRKENTYSDFYLAGRNMSTFVLCLTFFATQYSGNAFLGLPANLYRTGFDFFVSMTFYIGIVAVYLVYAPKLYKLSRQKHYVTPGDFIKDRWNSYTLLNLTNVIFFIVMISYIISNLKVMGLVVSHLTQDQITFNQAIIGLTIVILIYETIGGMRAVAWTDALQGIILLAGGLCLFVMVQVEYGTIFSLADEIRVQRPAFFDAPDAARCCKWLSTLFVISFGAAVYPHAIQRIFSAKSELSLQRSFKVMLFLPFFTIFPLLLIALTGVAVFPELSKSASETVVLKMLTDMITKTPGLSWVLLVFFGAIIAAIMSTLDSVILSLSSIVTKDFQRSNNKNKALGNSVLASWVIMLPCVLCAIFLPQTIWQMMEFKLDFLVQLAPLFILGIFFPKIKASHFIVSIAIGALTILYMHITGTKISFLQTGIVGLAFNLIVLAGLNLTKQPKLTDDTATG